MKRVAIIIVAVLIAAALSACQLGSKKAEAITFAATSESFVSSAYTLKKGQAAELIYDPSSPLLAVEIKGMSVKIDKASPSKKITPETPGIYDIIGNLGEGKTIKAVLTVIE